MPKFGFAALCAAILSLAAPAAYAGVGVGLGQAYPVACGSGYRPDRGGNCQPDVPQVNRYCPTGQVIQPAFNGDGYTCQPPPPEAY